MLTKNKINNKGFTLVEVLGVLVIIAAITVIAIHNLGGTMSASKEETYKIMKNNIISAGYTYIKECEAGTTECDFSYSENNRFSASNLKESGYFNDLESPLDGKDLGNCLILEATKTNGVTTIDLIDKCY